MQRYFVAWWCWTCDWWSVFNLRSF